jgi:hypothetical protein
MVVPLDRMTWLAWREKETLLISFSVSLAAPARRTKMFEKKTKN